MNFISALCLLSLLLVEESACSFYSHQKLSDFQPKLEEKIGGLHSFNKAVFLASAEASNITRVRDTSTCIFLFTFW